MKLEKLSLQGFKSFRERTIISFDDGVTGIVGPNGCGKSNIVDALFWVMGEQSAKHLRGDKMSDLIFNGTDKYSPSSFAEVTLTLKNTHHKHIHIGNKVVQPEEIELSRKLYRNSETEYRINGMPARLKDIQEVFMDTGAGAKSYSVIAQGEIDRLVRAKPEDRRIMIDEVAGITKFKHRRKESLRKMEQTQSNLDRLSDLQKEVHKNLKDLEQQAGKAKRAKLLREKVQHHNLVVASHKEHDYLEKIFNFKEKVSTNEMKIETLKNEAMSIELTMEDEQLQKIELMEKLEAAQTELTQTSKQLSSKEDEIKYTQISLQEKKRLIEERKSEIQQIEDEVANRSERKAVVENELSELNLQQINGDDIEQLENLVNQKKEELQQFEQEKNRLQSEKQQAFYDAQEVAGQVFRHQAKIEQLSADLQEVTQEIDLLEIQTGAFADEAQGKRDLLKDLEKRVADFKQSKDKATVEFKELNEKIEIEKEKIQQIHTAVVALESKIQSLKEVNETDLSKKGAQTFFNSENKSVDDFSLIGKLVQTDAHYSAAMQRTLASIAECIVFSETKNKDELLQWVITNSENVDWCYGLLDQSAVGDDLSDHFISFESVALIANKTYSGFKGPLFANRWISEGKTMEEVLKLAEGKKFTSIVDAMGKFLIYQKDGLVLVDCNYKDEKSNTGLIERSIKIQQFENALLCENENLAKAKDALFTLVQAKEVKELNLNSVSASLERNTEQLIGLRSELQAQESGLQVGASRLEVLKNKKMDFSHQRLTLLENDDVIQKQKDESNAKIEEVDEKLKTAEQKLVEEKIGFDKIRDELLQKKTFIQTKQQQENNLKSQLGDIIQRLTNLENRRTHYLQLVESALEEIITAEKNLAQARQEVVVLATALNEKSELSSELKESLDQVLEVVGDREQSIKSRSKEISQLEKEVVEAKLKYDQILEEEELVVRNTFEQYRVDLRATLAKFFSFSENQLEVLRPLNTMYTLETAEGPQSLQANVYEFEKRFPAQVKESQEKARRYNSELNSIGEINWTADEEYERQKIRYEFLCEQENELKKSLEDLHSAITMIDQKSVVRFKMAYEEINDKFSKVFPIIFGGGSASLELTSSPDDPECGVEIIAQPPGKKMQNINLMSGGEKALTAVSLIFSIFLIKPSPFCLLDEVDAPLDDANVGRFNELLREMSTQSQFILITHNKKTMELNDTLYGITMQEPGVSKALSVQLH